MKNKRLLSLDILRGLDLMFLVGLQPVLLRICNISETPFLNVTVKEQLTHVAWEGFSTWDLVMPLFLFMAGVTIPFATPKYIEQGGNKLLWKRVLKRFVLLFLLGMFVQGNLLSLNPDAIYLYTNTLQAIAAGYLIAVPISTYLKPKYQALTIAALLVIYAIPMDLLGDWSRLDNFAALVDKAVLGRFRDGSYFADGEWHFAQWYDNTWIWSTLTFGATVAMGALAGTIIKNGDEKREKSALVLLAIGVSLIALGYLWGLYHPIIKRVWSSSMTVYSGGICFVLLAIFYWWIDVKGHSRGLKWLRIYGCNSIIAYIMGEIINFRCIATSLLYGFEQYLEEWYPVLITAANSFIIFGILYFMNKYKIYLKV